LGSNDYAGVGTNSSKSGRLDEIVPVPISFYDISVREIFEVCVGLPRAVYDVNSLQLLAQVTADRPRVCWPVFVENRDDVSRAHTVMAQNQYLTKPIS
jgi:hypothetical protein